MSNVIQITSNNFNGQYADITFYPCSGGSINLGYQLLPYDYAQDNYEGTYDIYVSAYTLTCQLVIACPSPTPTSTTTPTITPTMTVTPTNTVTPTPSYFSYSGLFYSGLTACDACALTSSTVTLYWDINYGPTLQVGEYVWLNPGPAFGGFVPNGYYILSTDTNNYFGISAGSQVYEISGCTVCTPTPTPTPTLTPTPTALPCICYETILTAGGYIVYTDCGGNTITTAPLYSAITFNAISGTPVAYGAVTFQECPPTPTPTQTPTVTPSTGVVEYHLQAENTDNILAENSDFIDIEHT